MFLIAWLQPGLLCRLPLFNILSRHFGVFSSRVDLPFVWRDRKTGSDNWPKIFFSLSTIFRGQKVVVLHFVGTPNKMLRIKIELGPFFTSMHYNNTYKHRCGPAALTVSTLLTLQYVACAAFDPRQKIRSTWAPRTAARTISSSLLVLSVNLLC